MRLCKYCNKPIAEKDIWNPDNDGNGYHHKCLVHMELKARNKQIYDKGKMDVLDRIRAEIEQMDYLDIEDGSDGYDQYINKDDVLAIIDKYKEESEGKE